MLQSCAGLASAPCLAVTGAQLLDHPEACIRLSIVPGYVSKVKWGTRCWGTVLAWHAPCACLACTQCSTGAGIKLLECLSFAQPPPAVCSVCPPYTRATSSTCCSVVNLCCAGTPTSLASPGRLLYPLPSTLLRVSCAVLPKLLYNSKSKFTCRLRCPEAAVLVAANQDAYVSRQSVIELAEHWPGCEVRWVEGGHVSAFLMQQPAFRTAILDSLNRLPKDP